MMRMSLMYTPSQLATPTVTFIIMYEVSPCDLTLNHWQEAGISIPDKLKSFFSLLFVENTSICHIYSVT